MQESPASSKGQDSSRCLDRILEEFVRFSKENGGISRDDIKTRLMDVGCECPFENIVATLEAVGAKVIDEHLELDDDADHPSGRQGRSSPAPWNTIGMYLQNSSKTKTLSKDEERIWFQIIDASSAKLFELFGRYPFAAEMYIRELDSLESGKQHFDSIISENSGMSCAEYKRQIPNLRKSLLEAVDLLVGASALSQSIGCDNPSAPDSMLASARCQVVQTLRSLSFRQSVVEDLCDVAYEDIYLPYVAQHKSNAADANDGMSSFGTFGMTPDEFMDSFEDVRRILGIIQTARAKIAEANLRLVVHVAKKFTSRGIELSDLLQDGSIGLMNAIRKFDISRGLKFSTFATWWIRQAISRALTNNSRTIRIPSHKIDQLSKLDKMERILSQRLHRPPTEAETAMEMGISLEDIRQLHGIRQQTVSLDGALGEDGDASLVDVISDDKCVDPAAQTEKSLMCERMHKAMSVLTEREKMVIDLRFGLSNGSVRTLEEIGQMFNVTREHIRQVELEALGKLRRSNSLNALAELVR